MSKVAEGEEIPIPNQMLSEDFLVSNTLWPETTKLYGHGYEITCLAAANTKPLLASACRAQSAKHAAIILWDLTSITTMKNMQSLEGHGLSVTALCFNQDDSRLLSISRDRMWILWGSNGTDGRWEQLQVKKSAHARVLYSAVWLAADVFATGSRDKRLKVWKDGEITNN